MGMSLPLRLDPLEHDQVVADHLDVKTAQARVRGRGKGRVRLRMQRRKVGNDDKSKAELDMHARSPASLAHVPRAA